MISLLASIMVTSALHGLPQPTYEDNSATPIILECESTAYCYGETTCTGKRVREGYAAMAKKYVGMTALVYTTDMELVGIYEIEDTGGDERIKKGECIDIYMPSYDDCMEYGRRNVIVYLYDAQG